eukprot:185010-Lingulodinium_polyedra.AAC.1
MMRRKPSSASSLGTRQERPLERRGPSGAAACSCSERPKLRQLTGARGCARETRSSATPSSWAGR